MSSYLLSSSICTETNSNSGAASYYCPGWYLFVLPSVCIYFGVLLILGLISLLAVILCPTPNGVVSYKRCIASSLHDFAFGHSRSGRFLLFAIFVMSLTSFGFYLVAAGSPNFTLRSIVAKNATYTGSVWTSNILLTIDFSLNCFYSAHFFLRLIAASDKLQFWLSWSTAVDVATIPTNAMFIYYRLYWSGLRFFRAMYILVIPNMLEIIGLIKDTRLLRICRIFFAFLTLWLVSAGCIHLFENNGDPWLDYYNGQELSYFECIYFLIITSSTIGYGDITCKTTLGRIFDIGFVFVGLGMFANIVPEIITIMQLVSPYNGSLRLPVGKRHIVVIGHVTTESAIKFFKAFRRERGDLDIAVVFLYPEMPSARLDALIKRKKNLYYFRGEEMENFDLNRVNLAEADACIILADQHARNPEEEDSANIMRAIAIKNHRGGTRVLIQLLLVRMESNLPYIPHWDSRCDAAISLDESKMGTLAQNCWAPGFATLLSLLLTAKKSNSKLKKRRQNSSNLDKLYLRGAAFKLLSTVLSPDFAGMSFTDAAATCFEKLDLTLIAVKAASAGTSQPEVMLNPGKSYTIENGDEAFFISLSILDVQRAQVYCRACHQGAKVETIKRCKCRPKPKDELGSNLMKVTSGSICNNRIGSMVTTSGTCGGNSPVDTTGNLSKNAMLTSDQDHSQNGIQNQNQNKIHDHDQGSERGDEVRFDATGTLYWRTKRTVEQAVMAPRDAAGRGFRNHIIVCIFGDRDSPPLGLRNFIVPLRSSNRTPQELKDIILIGDINFIANEWDQIDHFPNIFIIQGSAMRRKLLLAANVRSCSMCVILSAVAQSGNKVLTDKYAILCYLNIKSMQNDSVSNSSSKSSANLSQLATAEVTLSLSSESQNLPPASDFSAGNTSALFTLAHARRMVPVITTITSPKNIKILDNAASRREQESVMKVRPFESGEAFTGKMMDTAIISAFFNPNVLTLVRELTTGGMPRETDQSHLDDLERLDDSFEDRSDLRRYRTRISHFSMSDTAYSHLVGNTCTYAELFLAVLRRFDFVCLGVSRLQGSSNEMQRIVLANPPDDFRMIASDIVICLQPVQSSVSAAIDH